MNYKLKKTEKKRFICILLTVMILVVLSGCGSVQLNLTHDDYQEYVKKSLSAVFGGDYKSYMDYNKDGENVVLLHDRMISYFTEMIYCRYGIDPSCMSASMVAAYEVLTDAMLKKISFEVSNPRQINGEYKVDVAVKPLVFWQLSDVFCEKYAEEYKNRLCEGAMADMTDVQWQQSMSEYAEQILSGMQSVQERVTGFGQEKNITITIKENKDGTYYLELSEFFVLFDYALGIN